MTSRRNTRIAIGVTLAVWLGLLVVFVALAEPSPSERDRAGPEPTGGIASDGPDLPLPSRVPDGWQLVEIAAPVPGVGAQTGRLAYAAADGARFDLVIEPGEPAVDEPAGSAVVHDAVTVYVTDDTIARAVGPSTAIATFAGPEAKSAALSAITSLTSDTASSWSDAADGLASRALEHPAAATYQIERVEITVRTTSATTWACVRSDESARTRCHELGRDTDVTAADYLIDGRWLHVGVYPGNEVAALSVTPDRGVGEARWAPTDPGVILVAFAPTEATSMTLSAMIDGVPTESSGIRPAI